MTQRTPGFAGEEVREESSWTYPLVILLTTLTLSAVFLYYYVGPSIDDIAGDTPKPTISDEPVALTIGAYAFEIPANYTVYPRARRGGARAAVALYALWPNLSPYSPARRDDFVDNQPDTRRIDIDLVGESQLLTERQRFERIYRSLLIDPDGGPTPYGLTKYVFADERPDTPMSGYRDEELFTATRDGEMISFRCVKALPEYPSPHCRRDYTYKEGLTISYSFKRPHLPEWREIDAKVAALVETFLVETAPPN